MDQNTNGVLSPTEDFFSNILKSAGGTIVAAAVVAIVTTYFSNFGNSDRIKGNADGIKEMSVTIVELRAEVNELKMARNVSEFKVATLDSSIKKLQADVDNIKYKTASLPDRNELNEALNTLYLRLRESNKTNK